MGFPSPAAFVVIAVNSLATAGMLIYPRICVRLGFDPQTNVMLGCIIHDVAIAAPGLDTSPAAVARLGWRHVAAVSGTTVLILIFVNSRSDGAGVGERSCRAGSLSPLAGRGPG